MLVLGSYTLHIYHVSYLDAGNSVLDKINSNTPRLRGVHLHSFRHKDILATPTPVKTDSMAQSNETAPVDIQDIPQPIQRTHAPAPPAAISPPFKREARRGNLHFFNSTSTSELFRKARAVAAAAALAHNTSSHTPPIASTLGSEMEKKIEPSHTAPTNDTIAMENHNIPPITAPVHEEVVNHNIPPIAVAPADTEAVAAVVPAEIVKEVPLNHNIPPPVPEERPAEGVLNHNIPPVSGLSGVQVLAAPPPTVRNDGQQVRIVVPNAPKVSPDWPSLKSTGMVLETKTKRIPAPVSDLPPADLSQGNAQGDVADAQPIPPVRSAYDLPKPIKRVVQTPTLPVANGVYDFCGASDKPMIHTMSIPVDQFQPVSGSQQQLRAWQSAVMNMKARMQRLEVGGKELRDLLQREVGQLKEQRIEIFCPGAGGGGRDGAGEG